MREYQHESVLRAWADTIAENITIDNGLYEAETKRKPTKRERETLRDVAYGALLALNWGAEIRDESRAGQAKVQAVLDCAEFTADLLFDRILPEGKRLQGYISIYCPLRKALANWPRR